MALQPTVPVRHWSPEQRLAVERKAIEIVAGVGDAEVQHWQQGTLALHYRRPMTADEARRLPPPSRTTPEYNARVRSFRMALQASGVIDPADIKDLSSGS